MATAIGAVRCKQRLYTNENSAVKRFDNSQKRKFIVIVLLNVFRYASRKAKPKLHKEHVGLDVMLLLIVHVQALVARLDCETDVTRWQASASRN